MAFPFGVKRNVYSRRSRRWSSGPVEIQRAASENSEGARLPSPRQLFFEEDRDLAMRLFAGGQRTDGRMIAQFHVDNSTFRRIHGFEGEFAAGFEHLLSHPLRQLMQLSFAAGPMTFHNHGQLNELSGFLANHERGDILKGIQGLTARSD